MNNTYIYQTKENVDVEKLKEIGFELLPEEVCGIKNNDFIYYKIVKQPEDGECVNTLIGFYNFIADNICGNKFARKAHANMGIKFRAKKGKHHLVVTPELREMFSAWRIEINLQEDDANVYFTISDGNMPRFHDAEHVMEKYCKEDIDLLVLNNIIEKVQINVAKVENNGKTEGEKIVQ